MGNGCSAFEINKVCINGEVNIVGKVDLPNQNDDLNNMVIKRKKSNRISSSIKKQSSINSNGIKNKEDQNHGGYEANNSNSSLLNALQSQENIKVDNNNQKSNFTNLMQDLDFSFNKGKGIEQNDLFNINYIQIKNEYNSEIIDYLNKIRTEPKNIVNDIDELLNKSKKNINNKVQIESDDTHENIILDDGGEALIETKNFLNNAIPVEEKLELNEDLYIDISDSEKNMDTPLDKKINKILTDKRKNIIDDYNNCQFFINFIKDKKIGLLFLLSQNENMSNFRTILFDKKYNKFNVTWMNEKKRIFISFLCFA